MAETNLTHEQEMEVESHTGQYMKVFFILLVFTIAEYCYASFLHLSFFTLVVGLMAMALFKASLVGLYFMHLKYDERYHVFVFLSTLIFVGIFFTFVLFDLNSRAKLSEEQGTFFRNNYDRAPPPKQELPPGVEPAEH